MKSWAAQSEQLNDTYFIDAALSTSAANVIRLGSHQETVPLDSGLTPADLRKLERESWIDADLTRRAGIRRVDSFEGARLVGREKQGASGQYSGLWLPYYAPFTAGERGDRLRRDRPDYVMNTEGKLKEENKYLAPPGQRNMLYFGPNQSRDELQDMTLPLMLFEGEKKTLSGYRLARHGQADQPRFLAVGISGVYNWRGTIGRAPNAAGEMVDIKGPIPDLDHLALTDREVLICFDADVHTNETVRIARFALRKELKRRGAIVRFFDVPGEAAA